MMRPDISEGRRRKSTGLKLLSVVPVISSQFHIPPMRMPILSSDEVVSIVIRSEARGYGPAPDIGDEIQQTVVFSPSGYVKVTRIFYAEPEKEFTCYIDSDSFRRIIDAVVDAMGGPFCDGCDMTMWFVDMKVGNGGSVQYAGSIDGSDLRSGRYRTSALIRRILRDTSNKTIQRHLSDISELRLFDGGE